ncbi:hypothetical protein MPTK1_8g10020 [Marchantia polymorpha subsp. ruderalis]|uniref:Uncharacterized protein n=1 Tax=Marchantia polymorpha TaxID=3197 RepID=A0A2R6XMX4_MARPO|nr:hypothetical protein MARPO_0008s0220 [Marchantia polymorpha]BBN19359.1 hypothetical protein Mp_8g10020 [Marchantia polymorpha subsp. ruderalis]|eukprot:PTQ47474.1 hypothetical protein MARPO_0008s0220 [Marchantia polymorpha]
MPGVVMLKVDQGEDDETSLLGLRINSWSTSQPKKLRP